jgi:hypothetical protein
MSFHTQNKVLIEDTYTVGVKKMTTSVLWFFLASKKIWDLSINGARMTHLEVCRLWNLFDIERRLQQWSLMLLVNRRTWTGEVHLHS